MASLLGAPARSTVTAAPPPHPAVCQEVPRERRRTPGKSQSEALPAVTAGIERPAVLQRGLHTLGDHRATMAVRADQRDADQRSGFGFPAEAADQRAVQLEALERQKREDHQARVAYADVVHAEAHAQGSQSIQHSTCASPSSLARDSTGSGTSRPIGSAGRWWRSSSGSMWEMNPAWRRCAVARSTHTGTRRPSSRQRRARAQASSNTHPPRSWISPVAWAMWINAAGGTTPRLGLRHRNRASTPTTRGVASSIGV